MTAVLDRLTAMFDYVLVDSPPVLLVADALELARNVDGVVLVVRRGSASTDEARELRATVDRLGIHLVGAVMTDVEPVRSYGAYGDAPPSNGGRRRRHREQPRPAPEPEPAAAGPASEEVF
jgi:Mrp family chromosome partitioning ATPase